MNMKQTVLIIDAGHGGIDPKGAYTTTPSKMTKHKEPMHTPDGWFYEGVFNRQVAAEFIAEASKLGFLCMPVYHNYKDNSLTDRTNQANVIKGNFDHTLFLSFHSNAISSDHNPQSKARGVTMWTLSNTGVAQDIARQAGEPLKLLFESKGSKRASFLHNAGFHVLLKTTMPAILLELGFFDNTEDARLLINKDFISQIAKTLAKKLDEICK